VVQKSCHLLRWKNRCSAQRSVVFPNLDGFAQEMTPSRVSVTVSYRRAAAARQADVSDVEIVADQHDERIVGDKVVGRDKLRGEAPRADESGREWRNGNEARDTTLL
jgi:hypothetical protein